MKKGVDFLQKNSLVINDLLKSNPDEKEIYFKIKGDRVR